MSGRGNGKVDAELIMPVQFADLRGRAEGGPERRLMVAVLEDAVLQYQHHLRHRDTIPLARRMETHTWLFSHDRQWLFTCENICDVLGIDVEYLRRGLRALGNRVLERTRGRVDRRAGSSDLSEGTNMRPPANAFQPRWVG